MTAMKRCKACDILKATTEFHKSSKNADGLRGKCKACWSEVAAQWRENNPDAHREIYKRANHRVNLKMRFGITVDQFDKLVESSDGLCAICRNPESRDRRLSLDHDHKTGEIRGFLCSRCNLLLGNASDDHMILDAAAAYLQSAKLDVPPADLPTQPSLPLSSATLEAPREVTLEMPGEAFIKSPEWIAARDAAELKLIVKKNASLMKQLGEALVEATRLDGLLKQTRADLAAVATPPILQVMAERLRQNEQWGGPNHDDKHNSKDWLRFIADHSDRARRAVNLKQPDWDEHRKQLVEIAALAVAAIEAHDRNRRGKP